MQHACSHYNAISNHRCKKRIELRTQEEAQMLEHHGGTNHALKRPQLQPPCTRGWDFRLPTYLLQAHHGFVLFGL
eukprot:s421_g4.t1